MKLIPRSLLLPLWSFKKCLLKGCTVQNLFVPTPCVIANTFFRLSAFFPLFTQPKFLFAIKNLRSLP